MLGYKILYSIYWSHKKRFINISSREVGLNNEDYSTGIHVAVTNIGLKFSN